MLVTANTFTTSFDQVPSAQTQVKYNGQPSPMYHIFGASPLNVLSFTDENITVQIKINQGHLMSAVFLYCAGTVHSCTKKTGLRIRIRSFLVRYGS